MLLLFLCPPYHFSQAQATLKNVQSPPISISHLSVSLSHSSFGSLAHSATHWQWQTTEDRHKRSGRWKRCRLSHTSPRQFCRLRLYNPYNLWSISPFPIASSIFISFINVSIIITIKYYLFLTWPYSLIIFRFVVCLMRSRKHNGRGIIDSRIPVSEQIHS